MRLILIRHAQSANNVVIETGDYASYLATRVPEPPITSVGVEQAAALAREFPVRYAPGKPKGRSRFDFHPAGEGGEHGITHFYASPMLRTLQTALPLAQALSLQPEVWPAIHEHGGTFRGDPHAGEVSDLHGLTRAEMAAQFPGYHLPEAVGEAGWWRGGYETIEECDVRATAVAAHLRAMAALAPEATVLLVTHGTFLDRFFKALLGLGPSAQIVFNHLNTAVSRVDFLEEGWVALRYLNRVEHLPAALVTR
jgi:broad specificity phosphatase PhoE